MATSCLRALPKIPRLQALIPLRRPKAHLEEVDNMQTLPFDMDRLAAGVQAALADLPADPVPEGEAYQGPNKALQGLVRPCDAL
jgi:hypothetical protein